MTLTSCTVPTDGAVGLTRDSQGHVRFVIHSCQGYHDVVELSGSKNSKINVEYTHDGHLQGTNSFVADTPQASDGWTPKGTWDGTLPQGAVLYAYGATTNNYWSATGVSFTHNDLTHLKPGLIFAESFDATDHDLGPAMLTPAQFEVAACRASGTTPTS